MSIIAFGRISNRPCVEDFFMFTMTEIKNLDLLKDECVTPRRLVCPSRGRISASFLVTSHINRREASSYLHIKGTAYGRDIDHYVTLDPEPMRFGGVRWYALCPATGDRCKTLVLTPDRSVFVSRKETRLPNRTQCMNKLARARVAVEKAEKRRQGLSKYAHQSTRDKLTELIIDKEMIHDDERDRYVDRLWAMRSPISHTTTPV
jgi:hypothetical protein